MMHFIVQVCLDKIGTKHNLLWLWFHSNAFGTRKGTINCVSKEIIQYYYLFIIFTFQNFSLPLIQTVCTSMHTSTYFCPNCTYWGQSFRVIPVKSTACSAGALRQHCSSPAICQTWSSCTCTYSKQLWNVNTNLTVWQVVRCSICHAAVSRALHLVTVMSSVYSTV